ncbi:methyltransferase [Mycobacterium sp.]|uniref:methyltransferase n=1 Tax=Mycobacterium sp. TaxID=1785 RepID=UPI0031D1EB31
MGYLLLTCVMFALAIGVNSGSVFVQKRFEFYNRRHINGWLLHSLVILPCWAIFVYLLVNLNSHYLLRFPAVPVVGYIFFALATLLFGLAIREIGWQSLANGNWFGRGKMAHVGIFKFLKNPIYDSYLLAFIGVALTRGNAAYLVIALESYIGLNVIETRLEQVQESQDVATGEE